MVYLVEFLTAGAIILIVVFILFWSDIVDRYLYRRSDEEIFDKKIRKRIDKYLSNEKKKRADLDKILFDIDTEILSVRINNPIFAFYLWMKYLLPYKRDLKVKREIFKNMFENVDSDFCDSVLSNDYFYDKTGHNSEDDEYINSITLMTSIIDFLETESGGKAKHYDYKSLTDFFIKDGKIASERMYKFFRNITLMEFE